MEIELTDNELFQVVDSTKLQTYASCPRKYFYSYILGWRGEQPNLHLEFGSAWHLAMEHLLRNGYTDESIQGAFNKLVDYYSQYWPPELWPSNEPKDPATALKALVNYCDYYRSQDHFDVLHTEVVGTVPIDEDLPPLHFKIDAICRDERGLFVLEHKTTGMDSKAWDASWLLSLQVGTYYHVLNMFYPEEKVYGVIVNGTIFRRETKAGKGCGFKRVHVYKGPEQMRMWLYSVRHKVTTLLEEQYELEENEESDDILRAFPLNETACTDYGVCPFHSFCTAWANPLQRCEVVPPGFKVEHWDPRAQKANATVQEGGIKNA